MNSMAEGFAAVERTQWKGFAGLRLTTAAGDSAFVADQGAQVLSWMSGGRERLYLSPRALSDGHSAIRGGIPLCFPQFNQRGPGVKHGFARNLLWSRLMEAPEDWGDDVLATNSAGVCAYWRLNDGDVPVTAGWSQPFDAVLCVALHEGTLTVVLRVHNSGVQPLSFTGALHTYLRVDDIRVVQIDGLQDRVVWDALTDTTAMQSGAVVFDGEYDRVFDAPTSGGIVQLMDGASPIAGAVAVQQSPSWGHTVVWNPGAALCARLADMPADGYQHMVCVEAAQVFTPVVVSPGATWQGGQRLLARAGLAV
jgi:glucose-6-phosphate 1-epimerase